MNNKHHIYSKHERAIVLFVVIAFIGTAGLIGFNELIKHQKNKNMAEIQKEIDAYMATQPNYNDSIKMNLLTYGQEIKNLKEKLDKLYTLEFFYINLANDINLQKISENLSEEQKQHIEKTLISLNKPTDSENLYQNIETYYSSYIDKKIDKDSIINIYEYYVYHTPNLKIIEKLTGTKDEKGIVAEITEVQKSIDSLDQSRLENIHKFQKSTSIQNLKNKRFLDSLYTANQIKQRKPR